MIAQQKAALHGGGRNESSALGSYPIHRSASSKIGARLSPRRKLYAQRLLDHLNWHGRKILIDEGRYADLCDKRGLDRFAVNQAVDDLYALGLADVRMAGVTQVVTSLAGELDEGAL